MHDRVTGEEIPTETLSPEIRQQIADVSDKQAHGFDGGSITVHKAWNYHGALQIAAEGAKAVAIELTIELAPKSHFDFDDIDIIDAADDKNYGSDPHLQRVTDKGEAAAWEDPVFAEGAPLHIVGLWAVPASTTSVKLGYWGQTLTPAIPIGAVDGPAIPEEKMGAPTAYLAYGTTDTGLTRHLFALDCFCARTASPPSYQLVDSRDSLRYIVKIVEVDAHFMPLAKDTARPYYGQRRWVVEIWADAKAHDLNLFGKRSPFPKAKLEMSKPLLAALSNAPLDREGVEMNAAEDAELAEKKP